MSNQKPRTIEEQMLRLKSLGMEFYDESLAKSYLSRIKIGIKIPYGDKSKRYVIHQRRLFCKGRLFKLFLLSYL